MKLKTPLLASTAILLLASCKPREIIQEVPVEVPHYIHDTLKVTVKEKEEIHVTDSMWIKGDTVFKYRDRWHSYAVHDTIEKIKNDTIGVPVQITKAKIKEVEKKLSWIQKTLMIVGVITIIAAAIYIFVRAAKRKLL